MATWNGERFVGEQLDSLSRQSRLPDELIVADDGSSDATLDVVRRFVRRAPFDVVVLDEGVRLGYGDNFFKAMRACTGDVISLCDQDDVWHVDKLARCVSPFESREHVSLVAHTARVVDASLRPVGWCYPHFKRDRILRPGSIPPFGGWPGFALTIRSQFVRRLDPADRPAGFFAGMGEQIVHDVWSNLVGGALGYVALIAAPLALHRRHGANTSTIRQDSWVWRSRTSRALADESHHFRSIAAATGELRSYLAGLQMLASDLGQPAQDGLRQTLAIYDRYASAMARRADLYASRARPVRVAGHAVRGDYGRRSAGGLGTSSLGRDLTLGLLRPRPS